MYKLLHCQAVAAGGAALLVCIRGL
eukprot:COSAG01_NODE_39491_length_475_cov_12.986702_1_plen_24_part_10